MKNKLLTFTLLTRRNVLLFLTNKTTVFFSLLANVIILSLYLLFLKTNYVTILTDSLAGLEISAKLIDGFVNSYLIAGILGTTCITVALNSLSVMVKDREDKVDLDYKSSPVSKTLVSLSYFLGALICTFIIGAVFLTLSLIVLAVTGSFYLSIFGVIKLYLILLLGCISSTTIMVIVASFFKSSSGLGAFGGIVSAVSGFLIGAYMPISQFSDGIQIFSNTLPASHIAALLRNELLNPVLNEINVALAGSDGGMFAITMREVFAFKLNFFGNTINMDAMYIYVAVSSVVFGAISVFVFKKLNK
ncbi:MAG: ABC transporter permease [bacterium]